MRRKSDPGAAPPPRRRNPAHELARAAEDAAALFLRARGFHLEDRNVRVGRDELDLIALDPSSLVVVEVRARSDSRFRAEDSLDIRKRRRLLRAGRRFWERWHGLDPETPLHGTAAGDVRPRALRFDLIAVSWSRDGFSLRHYPRFLRPGSPERL